MSNKQQVVLVTGGMGGLGETISTKMVDAGYTVAVTYSPGNTSHAQWVDQMASRGYKITAVACDVADYDSCVRAVGEVQAALGPIDVLVNNEMGWDTSKINVNGGAIAIGHPIGASGCRILVTLLHEMARRDAKKGIASLCIGGGMGVALTIER